MKRLRRIFDVTLLLLCAAAVVLWVRSAYHQELIGTYSLSAVQNGRVLERWAGVYSGSGGFAIGSKRASWTPEYYQQVKGVPPRSLASRRFGHFEDEGFGDEDGLGFGVVSRSYAASPPPGAARAALRQGRMPVFPFEGEQAYLALPYWVVILVGVLRVGWWARPKPNDSPLRTAFCRNCGYDLRATPDRCPECGRQPA